MKSCPLCEGSHAHQFVAGLVESDAYLCENQGARGWLVLVLREHVEHLAELPIERQTALFADVSRAAHVLRQMFGPVRINYECLGNVVGHVHWHVIPRHLDDPSPGTTVWTWPRQLLPGALSAEDRRQLLERIRTLLTESR